MVREAIKEGEIHDLKVTTSVNLTRLLFVDDMLLFDIGKLEEWDTFKEVLSILCEVSGMVINRKKYFFLKNEIYEVIEMDVGALMPYAFKDLDDGFKYLGFHLKLNNYKLVNWFWLKKRIEDRISHWCNGWTSLGGRFILLTFVLQSMLVFWISLEKILKLILNSIRSIIFIFLWATTRKKKCYSPSGVVLDSETQKSGRLGNKTFALIWPSFSSQAFVEESYFILVYEGLFLEENI